MEDMDDLPMDLPDKGEQKHNQEELLNNAKDFFGTQRKNLGSNAKRGEKVVTVAFDDLSKFSPHLAERLITEPEETLLLFYNLSDYCCQ